MLPFINKVHTFALCGGFDELVNVSIVILDVYYNCGAVEGCVWLYADKNSLSWSEAIGVLRFLYSDMIEEQVSVMH